MSRLSLVRELRLQFSPSAVAAKGLRDFLETGYPAFRAAHPGIPILIRESESVGARAFKRLDSGTEARISLEGLEAAQVKERLTEFVQSVTGKGASAGKK